MGSTAFTEEWSLETVSNNHSVKTVLPCMNRGEDPKLEYLYRTHLLLPVAGITEAPNKWAHLNPFLQLHLLSRSLMSWLLWSFIARCCSTWSSNSKMVSFRFLISASFSDVFSCSFWLVLLSCSACRSHTSFSWPYSFSAWEGRKKLQVCPYFLGDLSHQRLYWAPCRFKHCVHPISIKMRVSGSRDEQLMSVFFPANKDNTRCCKGNEIFCMMTTIPKQSLQLMKGEELHSQKAPLLFL